MGYAQPLLDAMTVADVDGTTTGSTAIDTTDLVRRFVPFNVNIEVTSITGTVVTPATITVGSGGGKNDILPATMLTGLTGVNQTTTVPITNVNSMAPDTTLFVNVTTAETGATTYLFRTSIMGLYY